MGGHPRYGAGRAQTPADRELRSSPGQLRGPGGQCRNPAVRERSRERSLGCRSSSHCIFIAQTAASKPFSHRATEDTEEFRSRIFLRFLAAVASLLLSVARSVQAFLPATAYGLLCARDLRF